MTAQQNYQKDFYAWCLEQATFLRSKEFEKLDIENLAEEIKDVGESRARELENCLRILFTHILKWNFQEHIRCNSLKNSINEHIRRVNRRLIKTPSLKFRLLEIALDAYEDAKFDAGEETGINKDVFPKKMFFTIEELLTKGWLP